MYLAWKSLHNMTSKSLCDGIYSNYIVNYKQIHHDDEYDDDSDEDVLKLA